MRTKSISMLLFIFSLLLAGCAPAPTPEPPTAEPEAGMANPAAVYCIEQGGALETRTEAGGEAGYCIFPDGSECEEWAFYRGECAPGGAEAPAEDESIGMANPAAVYCIEQGGTLEIRTEAGGEAGYCIFPDGSECEEWAFYRGECAPGGAAAPAAGDFQPLNSEACEELANAMAGALGVEVSQAEAPFQDYVGGGAGVGCQATATGTGVDFESHPAVAAAVQEALAPLGWQEDPMRAGGGPTGAIVGFQREADLCLLVAGWEPSEDANCPQDQPISACELMPEQQLYTITLNCAQGG